MGTYDSIGCLGTKVQYIIQSFLSTLHVISEAEKSPLFDFKHPSTRDKGEKMHERQNLKMSN